MTKFLNFSCLFPKKEKIALLSNSSCLFADWHTSFTCMRETKECTSIRKVENLRYTVIQESELHCAEIKKTLCNISALSRDCGPYKVKPATKKKFTEILRSRKERKKKIRNGFLTE